MTGPSLDAFSMVFWISVCAVTAFVALHWIMSAWFEHKLRGMEAVLLLCGLLGLMAVAISLVVRGEPGAVLMIVVVAGVGLFGRAMERRTNRKLADGLDRAAACDLLIAYVPSASMGTAIEMHEAYRGGALVVAITPLAANWVIRAYSHRIVADMAGFEALVASGELARLVEECKST